CHDYGCDTPACLSAASTSVEAVTPPLCAARHKQSAGGSKGFAALFKEPTSIVPVGSKGSQLVLDVWRCRKMRVYLSRRAASNVGGSWGIAGSSRLEYVALV